MNDKDQLKNFGDPLKEYTEIYFRRHYQDSGVEIIAAEVIDSNPEEIVYRVTINCNKGPQLHIITKRTDRGEYPYEIDNKRTPWGKRGDSNVAELGILIAKAYDIY